MILNKGEKMISITKNTNDPSVIKYTLEVYTDNEMLYKQSVEFGKPTTINYEMDKMARLQLMKEFVRNCDIETMDELFKIIPVYEKETDNAEEKEK